MSEVRTGVGLTPLSPAELLRALLLNEVDPGVVPNIVIGPATADQQAAGVAQIVDVGKAKVERYVPLIWPKHQIRCLAPTLSQADQIAQHVYSLLDRRDRTIVYVATYDKSYLVHHIDVAGGPTMHYDSPETWETLIYTDSCIGLNPIP